MHALGQFAQMFLTANFKFDNRAGPIWAGAPALRLKHKIVLLAVVPLLASLALIAYAVQMQQQELAQRQRLQLRAAYMATKESELRHYVALALSTISPLYNSGRNDDEIKRQAMALLGKLDYGADGYFFLYDMQGVNLMHPRQPELVGKNLIDMRDARGDPTIRMLIERARSGGGFVVYQWQKPSTHLVTSKLGYVTQMERWGWMVGTGQYLDDVDAVVEQLDRGLEANVHNTLLFIAGAGGLGVALIFACGLVLSFSEFKVSDAKLTLLTRQLVNSQEDERAHLSRELHDGTSQTLVAAKLLIESAHDRMAGADESVRAPLARALERLHQALVEVRGMAHRLRPVMLDTLGLPAALQHLGLETCGAAGMQFLMEVEGQVVDLPDDVKTVLFRITQEALTNIQKHAGSANVSVLLAFNPDSLRLSIHDDGRGFDAESVRLHPRNGIGLRNMRERMEGVGGQLVVKSQTGLTRITAVLPMAAVRRLAVAAPLAHASS
jgi:two-component system, NarL family, sensor kinase